jgi:hypothetical protein
MLLHARAAVPLRAEHSGQRRDGRNQHSVPNGDGKENGNRFFCASMLLQIGSAEFRCAPVVRRTIISIERTCTSLVPVPRRGLIKLKPYGLMVI